MKHSVVVGGGINGIVNAILLAQRGHKVIIIETSAKLGGLYTPVEIDGNWYDRGLYIPQLTGIDAVDQILLTSCDVTIRSGAEKDIAGNVFKGIHNERSLFVDTFKLQTNARERICLEMIERLRGGTVKIQPDIDLMGYFTDKFGPYATTHIFEPISHKIWRKELSSIASLALKVVHMSRILLFDEETSRILKETSAYFDDRIAFPNQLAIPDKFIQGKTSSFYPRKYGLHNILSGLISKLNALDISVKLNTKVERIEITQNHLKGIVVRNGSSLLKLEPDSVIWCAPPEVLHALLGFKKLPVADSPIPHITHYAICDAPPNTDKLYWSWDFDDNEIIRLSFPSNYCEELNLRNIHPILIESHTDGNLEGTKTAEHISNYLSELGIIERRNILMIHTPKATMRWFFVPSVNNIQREEEIISNIEKKNVNNIYNCAAKISRQTFYLHDLLSDGYKQLSTILEA